jgi:hypothetical protein
MQSRHSVAPAIPRIGDSDALLEAHFAASPTGILITDPAGEVRTYNERFLQRRRPAAPRPRSCSAT